VKVSPAQRIAIERRVGLEGKLHDFVGMCFAHVEPGSEFVDNWHLEEVCAHLEAMYRGEIDQLGICIPPGCMKSLVVSVIFPVWCWIRDPSLRFSVIGYDADLTGTRDGGKVVALVQSVWFQERWGDRVKVPTDPATSNVTTQAAGFRFATSIKGKYTGRHVHFEIVDDPTKPQDLSKAALEEVQTWRQRVAPTRLLPTKPGEPGGRIYIMQRLHENDAIGHAEREEQVDPGSWVFLVLPMAFESKSACVTPFGGDRRTEDGELLWPERFTAEIVKARERIMGPKNTAAQHGQKPSPDGGLVFNASTFKFYKCAPAKFDQVLVSVDAAFKGVDVSDYVVIQVWGRKGGEFFLLDMIRSKLTFTGTIEALKRVCRKWPRASAKLIEDKANGPAIIDTLKKEISGVIARNPEGGKEARANAVEPYFAAGNVYFPEASGAITQPDKQTSPEPCPWVDQLVTELLGFPTAAYDDAVDTLSQALLYFRERSSRYAEALAASAAKRAQAS
jgi:predicted phage terminase large subunit-like protein